MKHVKNGKFEYTYELRSISSKQNRPMIKLRSYSDDDDEIDYDIKFIYTYKDLLEALKVLHPYLIH